MIETPLLHVYQSNRLERLAERLGQVIREPGPAPLAPEILVVPNAGVGRWLALALARQLGISANLQMRFPAEFVWEVARGLLPAVPPRSSFDRELLVWRVFRALPRLLRQPVFAPIAAYLAGNQDRRRYELALQIAQVYDQYLVYRPDLIRNWEAGRDDHWQAVLWRHLADEGGDRHWAQLQEALLAALAHEPTATEKLPPRVTLFALSALSPGYLAIVAALAQRIEVHLHVLNPCREYWGDIVSERRLAAAAAQGGLEHAEVGNPLLASWGQQGRDFIDMIGEYGPDEEDLHVEPAADTMLGRVQADILELVNRAAPDSSRRAPAAEVTERRSLQVHACHSAMREVEVLHDQLLALIEETGVRPSDIVVLTPDIETYAPYIEAVFAAAPEPRRLPFAIADRALAAESPVVAGFFALLAAAEGRFDANSVLALLEIDAVRRRFDLAEADLPLVRRWVRESGIRWGVDAETRAQLGLPAFAENSWAHGLDRLTLGYALPGADGELFADILPYDDIEGSRAQVLGRLRAFAERLFLYCAELRRPRSAAEWVRLLARGLDLFFQPYEAEEEHAQSIRRALAALEQAAGEARLEEPLSLDLVRTHLEAAIEPPRTGGRFLAGGVTFGALVPMRSLPFRVVCLIGMNDGSFPRRHTPPGFDLIARHFRRGDRSRRADDRYLFLETLLAARDVLYLSYVGQGVRDNAPLPPSVLVSELLDYVRQAFRPPAGADIAEALVVRHPLQPFSPRYFQAEGRLFSYADDLARASAAAAGERDDAPLLLPQPLPPPEDEWRIITVERFGRFWRNPTRFLLKERLGIVLEEAEGLIEDHEPFDLDWDGEREVRTQLLAAAADREAARRAAQALRASGLLPVGEVGQALLDEQLTAVRAIAERLAALCTGGTAQALELDLACGDIAVTGALRDLWPRGRVYYELRNLGAGDRVDAWVHHLCLNVLRPAGIEPRTWVIGASGAFSFAPVENAGVHLRALAALYWEGLRRPLHFFPKSAYALVCENKDPRNEWGPSWTRAGEKEQAYFAYAFRARDPLDREFERLAREVLGPLHAHTEPR